MTKAQKAITLLLSFVIVGAVILWFRSKSVEEIITAEEKSDLWSSEIKMSFFSDSTYIVKLQNRNEYDSLVKRKMSGRYSLQNDTIYFEGEMDSLGISKAMIKNNLIEFPENDIDGITISRTSLELVSAINLKKYPDFIIYTYKPRHDPYFGPGAKPYDLQEKDMAKVVKLLETCPKDECQPKGYTYIKKCYASVNIEGEKEVVVTFNIRPDAQPERDGYCYPAVNINLSKLECRPVICFGG